MFKKKLSISLFSLLALSACEASSGVFRGLNANNPSPAVQKAIARDAGLEINSLFLPAHQKIIITQDVEHDAFGRAFSSDLRARGFALEERTEKNATILAKPDGLHLNYILDGTGEDTWRLQLISGTTKYTRQYQELSNPKSFSALGSWLKTTGFNETGGVS